MKIFKILTLAVLCFVSCEKATKETKTEKTATYIETEEFSKMGYPFCEAVRYGDILYLSGQFDHAKVRETKEVFDKINDTTTIDLNGLEFICSGGIGMLVMTFSRLKAIGKEIHLINLNDHIRNVFKVSNLDKVFSIK